MDIMLPQINQDYILDPQKLQSVDPVLLAQFLQDNRFDIMKRINATAKEFLSRGEVPGHEPAFATSREFYEDQKMHWYRLLYSRLCRKYRTGSAQALLFPIAVYLYDCYGLSCSKLILGCECATRLPHWLQCWLAQTEYLTNAETNELLDILESEPPVRCDTAYVFQSRVQEIAAEKGVEFSVFCRQTLPLVRDRISIQEYAGMKFQSTGNSYKYMRPALGTQVMFRFMVSLCVAYHVSPEYLLLQDYSNFVVTPQGRICPPAQRKLLSALLSAGADVRSRAVGFVLAASARHIAEGVDIPELAQIAKGFEQQANSRRNTSAVISSTPISQKKPTEKILLEQLKKQILEELKRCGEPVSHRALCNISDGFPLMAKRALLLLAEEGKIEQVTVSNRHKFWKISE